MALVLIETPGAANANSFVSLARAITYYEGRVPLDAWDNAGPDEQSAALVMATRVIEAVLTPTRVYVPASNGQPAAYKIRPTWTGTPVDDVQKLSWPRELMYTRNGYLIPNTIIPDELMDATAELAGQLLTTDSTLDNATAVKGIKSIKAGPAEIQYNAGQILTTKMLPDIVLQLLVPSWLTDEEVEGAMEAEFGIVFDASEDDHRWDS